VLDELEELVGVVRLALSPSTACRFIIDLSSKRDLPDRIGYCRTSKMSHDGTWREACLS
jgi:hypothetical protein